MWMMADYHIRARVDNGACGFDLALERNVGMLNAPMERDDDNGMAVFP